MVKNVNIIKSDTVKIIPYFISKMCLFNVWTFLKLRQITIDVIWIFTVTGSFLFWKNLNVLDEKMH